MKSVEELSRFISSKIFGLTVPFAACLAGPTCAGKTSVAEKMLQDVFVQSYRADILRLDDYMRDCDDTRIPLESGSLLYDHPQAYHAVEYLGHVQSLLTRQLDVNVPIYDIRDNRRSTKTRLINHPQILVNEGLFTIQLLEYADVKRYTVYFDVKPDVCLARRIKRDTVLYGVSAARVEKHFWSKVWPIYEPFGENQKAKADLVIS